MLENSKHEAGVGVHLSPFVFVCLLLENVAAVLSCSVRICGFASVGKKERKRKKRVKIVKPSVRLDLILECYC